MTPHPIDPDRLRTVHLIVESEAFKALYWDRDRSAMKPNLVFVERDGSVLFESNEVGLKGRPLDPSRKLGVVWGDSVVFSYGYGWPCLLEQFAPGYQFLNGGLDGDLYTNILRRAAEFNRSHPVALNLLMLGWHPFVPPGIVRRRRGRLWSRNGAAAPVRRGRGGNENIRADLTRFLERMPNTVVITMPTALNPSILDRDLSGYLVENGEDQFHFLGYIPYRIEGQRWGYEHIVERNAIVREVCAELGVRIVDLFARLDTENQADFRDNFIDVLHLRPRAYQLVAGIIYDDIKDLLV